MRLVVELDDLAALGRVVGVPPALEIVERLIGQSPTLADFIGERSGDVPPPSVEELLDDALSDEWQSTSQLLACVDCDRTTIRLHLQRREREGQIESKQQGRNHQWRLRSDR